MPVKTQIPSQEQIDKLRRLFLQKYDREPPATPFHPADMSRVKDGDLWLTRFLEMYDLDIQMSLDKLWETCTWRQHFGTNDLRENNLRHEYLRDGVVFAHNKDIDGKTLLIFRTKLHVRGSKDMDEVMRVVVYWIERIHRETMMDKITIFFDMAGTGMASMDLDFIKRIIEVFKLYYPNSLNYILVFEMSWVLNAAFKVIKGLLPAKALEILKMISKKDINTYVDKDNCLASWGGNDDYQFAFESENRGGKSQANMKLTNDDETETDDFIEYNRSSSREDKKVHFAKVNPTRVRLDSNGKMQDSDHFNTPLDHDMLRVSPKEYLTFQRGDSSESCVELTCINDFPVSYKIQTTSPEKFRVRPRCGVLRRGDNICVSIILKGEHQLADSGKDKFLVMCLPVPSGYDLTSQQLADMWKTKGPNSPDVEQHRLCCVYKGAEGTANGHASTPMADARNSADLKPDFWEHAKKLEKQVMKTQTIQLLSLIVSLAGALGVAYLIWKQMVEEDLDSSTCHVQGGYPLNRA